MSERHSCSGCSNLIPVSVKWCGGCRTLDNFGPFHPGDVVATHPYENAERGWWVISGDALMHALSLVEAGLDPTHVYETFYRDATIEQVEGREQ